MHIALFGGAFDPPHHGHQTIAKILIQQKVVDEVWFVPVKKHPFDKYVGEDRHRLAMLEFIVRDEQQLHIETYELDNSTKSYSYSTLQFLQTKFPEHRFSWIIGSDNVASFPQWFEFEKLLKTFTVLVYPRKGSEHVTLLSGMKWIKEVEPIDISSTMIRQKVQRGESIHGLVDPEVERYIREQRLYQLSEKYSKQDLSVE